MRQSQPAHQRRDDAGYVDLDSYAAIGDGRTVALIAADGRVDWLPIPDLDSTPAFAALLDARHGGFIALAPSGPSTVTRRYLPGTNVLETTFTTDTGVARVIDSMNTGVAGRLPWGELARRIDGVSGTVAMVGEVRLGTCLNTASPWVSETEIGPLLQIDGLNLAVRTSGRVSFDSDRVRVAFQTAAGSRDLLGVVGTDREPLYLPEVDDIDAGVDRTIANWQSWSDNFHWEGPFAEHVRRSALALKLLIHSPTGAVAAAATTSLPEWRTGGLNWDYRFAWLRDMAYSLTALFGFGLREEVHGAITWMLRAIHNSESQPRVAYRLDGSLLPGEEDLDVPGWRGIGPARAGNRARSQLQLGVFGDIFSIVSLYVDNGNVLDAQTARLLTGIADLACDKWRSPDAGMWELQDERHYTTSKLGCWKALTDAANLAEKGRIPGDVRRWRTEADRIRAWVDEHCWSDDQQCYVWHPGTDELDASILLHAISGFDRGSRMSSTLDRLRAELGTGPQLHRMTNTKSEEGAFIACSFWMVSALALVGRREEAEQLMAELVEVTGNDVGMLTEMVDPDTGEALGNVPQALSHLALIHAAITLRDGPDPR